MLFLQNLSYIHPNKELLFENIYLTVNSRDKLALIGNNGTGKSTLLKIIAGELPRPEKSTARFIDLLTPEQFLVELRLEGIQYQIAAS